MTRKELQENDLKKVAGGGGPSEYEYKGEIAYSGVECKKEPNDSSDTICTISLYEIVYVLETNCGNGYVKCIFRGDKHRETGYIAEKYITKIVEN